MYFVDVLHNLNRIFPEESEKEWINNNNKKGKKMHAVMVPLGRGSPGLHSLAYLSPRSAKVGWSKSSSTCNTLTIPIVYEVLCLANWAYGVASLSEDKSKSSPYRDDLIALRSQSCFHFCFHRNSYCYCFVLLVLLVSNSFHLLCVMSTINEFHNHAK